MRLTMATGLVVVISFNQLGCQQQPTEETEASVVTADQTVACLEAVCDKPAAETPVSAPKAPPVVSPAKITCDDLNIPSYDLWIKDLSGIRCDSCHNEGFAWKGLILTNYNSFKNNEKSIRYRIFNNLLTKPLDPIEQGVFLAWIDNGMPRTENDCEAPATADASNFVPRR